MDRPRDNTQRRRRRGLGLGVAVVALVGVLWAYTQLEAAVPNVDARTLLTDRAARGPLVIEVRGPGTLVPEKIRWVTALTAGVSGPTTRLQLVAAEGVSSLLATTEYA